MNISIKVGGEEVSLPPKEEVAVVKKAIGRFKCSRVAMINGHFNVSSSNAGEWLDDDYYGDDRIEVTVECDYNG